MESSDPLLIFFLMIFAVLSIVALLKSLKVDSLDEKLRVLSVEQERLRGQLEGMRRRSDREASSLPDAVQTAPPVVAVSSPVLTQRDTQPIPVVPFPPKPADLTEPVESIATPLPVAEPQPAPTPVMAHPNPEAPSIERFTSRPLEVPPPAIKAIVPNAPPQSLPRPVVVPPVVARSRRNLEDFLGTQLFLKLGVAILVIGLVFAMGLVFQMVGPLGKVLMGYGGGLALLLGGMAFERRERYSTFGRALIAGAWGILYFVTFAAGFLDASRVFHTKPVAVSALLLAGTGAVAFSLRYRREWTTVAAFLLIYLGLGMAAFHLHPDFNLSATLIVAMAMAALIWRTGWVRLLGLGVPATWLVVTLWMLSRPEGSLPLLAGLVAISLVFQAALLLMRSEDSGRAWLALGQIGNFLGTLALGLRETQPSSLGWAWALGVGLAHIGFAIAHGRKRRHALFLLTSTMAIASLAFVTPLRLGLKHHLTPLMRLLGLELLLVAGIFLKERYFRILAYVGFSLAILEILLLRSGAGGPERTILFAAGGLLFLLNAGLVRTLWREACEGEMPWLAWSFSLGGTLLLALLAGLEVSQPWPGTIYATVALLWVGIALAWGLEDLAFESVVLSVFALLFLLNVFAQDGVRRGFSGTGLGVLALVLAYGVQRLWRVHRLSTVWFSYFRWHFSLVALSALAGLVIKDVPEPWAGPALLMVGIVILTAGLRLGWQELLAEGLFLVPVALVAALPNLTKPGGTLLHFNHRAWTLGLLSLGVLGKGGLLSHWCEKWPWGDSRTLFDGALGALGALLLVVLILLEVPSPFIPFALMAQGLAWMLWARWHPSLSRWGVALGIQGVAFITLITHAWPLQGSWGAVPIRFGAMLLALPPAFLLHGLLRRMAQEEGLRDRVPSETIHWVAGASLICSSLVLTAVTLLDVPHVAVAATLTALGLLYLLWATWKPMGVRLHLATGFLILGFLGVASHGWWVQGPIGPFPARLVAVGLVLCLAFAAQYLLERASATPGARLLELASWEYLEFLAGVLLFLGSLVLAFLIKMEALAHEKNLLVALAWGLVGVLFLERQRSLRRGAWWHLGHLWLGAAYLHFLGVNLLQPGNMGVISLRGLSFIPMLGLLLYTYLCWVPAPDDEARGPWLRVGYFYGIQLAVSLFLLYEFHRAWVVTLWALQALVSLVAGLRMRETCWLRAALVLAVASLVRALGVNLYLRDSFQAFRLNWVALPLAVICLLTGYVLLNRHQAKEGSEGLVAFGAGTSRFPWFAAQALLLFSFIWVEVSGTALTVWLSGFGLCMVGIGFALQERVARLTGLSILSACILKLFLYDLRGLSGLPRVLSFSVLGVVLILVSYTYTRFKERVVKLL